MSRAVPEFESFEQFVDLAAAARSDAVRRDWVSRLERWVARRGYPLLEDSLAHFLYVDAHARSVTVPGDFNSWDVHADRMGRLEGTDLWYLTKRFPPDARLDYKFYVDGRWILDPRNPRTVTGGFGPNSELAMPAYVPAPEVEYREDIPHGEIRRVRHRNAATGEERTIEVYLPPGYETARDRYPALYVQDGGEYILLAQIDRVADHLIHRGHIRPVLLVCIPPVDRGREYRMNEAYLAYVVSQVVPYIDENYRTVREPWARGIMGASLGGLISAFISHRHPEVFGNCAGQSTYFGGIDGPMIRDLEESDRKPVRWYLDVGTFEVSLGGADLVEENRYVRDLLGRKGYDVVYRECPEGHSWGSWRAHTDDILRAFWPKAGGERDG